MKIVHILNGDCLAENFPKDMDFEIIIWRECLVDGPISEGDFFKNREKFISESYQISDANYHEKVFQEFEKLKAIPENSKAYLWFGDDLFCQVNFWFLVSSLKEKNVELFRVFPANKDFDFENFKTEDFQSYLIQSKLISNREQEQISKLWEDYQQSFSFQVFESEIIRRFDDLKIVNDNRFNGNLKKELDALKSGTDHFDEFFRKFQAQFPIYGFGDLQLKNFLA